jgi:prevent-host-death family protein
MKRVGAYEAKTHLPKLLEQVAEGQSFTITKHGVPVAVLSPYDSEKTVDILEVIRSLLAFRESNRLEGLNIRDMIEEGRNK